MFKRVAVSCDHAAFHAKQEIVAFLKDNKDLSVIDCGPQDDSRVDYPDFAEKACKLVIAGEVDCAVLLCGSGIGISIAANKVTGIRAALCHDHYTSKMCREHNDANVICAGARTTGIEVIKEMVSVFLTTPFAGGNHANRVAKIHQIESRMGASQVSK
eukprot:Tbor_TRINITY_DN1748_c0_g1::TRINITY_DN1748_c0_g1_i1::g.21330::m.21330/K01808/rpiB; ribose 5-phosphate isomerase B